MKAYVEIKRLENNDVIATSTVLFNTVQRTTDTKWLFYNVDLNNPNNRDTSKHIYSVNGTPDVAGVSADLFGTYEKIVEDENFKADNRVYHYVNGQWVECSSHCGTVDHASHQQLG